MWKNMSVEQKASLTKLYVDGGINDPEFVEAAWQLGIKTESLARYARNFKEYEDIEFDMQEETTESFVKLPAFESTPKLTDITSIEPDSDADFWVQWLVDRSKNNPVIKVMHLSDMHEPFKDQNAVNLAFQMVEATKPDVIVVGSDFWDFYLLSSFGTNPEVKMESYDELEMLESYWNRFINALNKVAPDAVFLFIWGNHEQRIIRYIDRNGVNLHRTIYNAFKHIVKCGGRVKYTGEVDHIRFGPLQVEHGVRYNMHATKSRLVDEGGQLSIWMGHGHKLKWYSMNGADFSVHAIMTGCLCQLTPHYKTVGSSAQSGEKWQHGTGVATLDLRDRLVSFENIEFVSNSEESRALFRGNLIRSDNQLIAPY